MARVVGPIDTSLGHTTGQDPLFQQRRLFDGIDIQARADVPGDVAMERPHTGIIGDVLQHDVPGCASGARLYELHVATLGI